METVDELKRIVWALMDREEALTKELDGLIRQNKTNLDAVLGAAKATETMRAIHERHNTAGHLFKRCEAGEMSEQDCFSGAKDLYEGIVSIVSSALAEAKKLLEK